MSNLQFEPAAPAVMRWVADRERIDALTGGVFRDIQFVQGVGPGETVAQLKFNAVFTERPTFSFGAELMPSMPVKSGQFPTCSAIVRDWNFQPRYGVGDRTYSGASVLIVTSGPPGQVMIVHCQFEGEGLWSPT